ncbi:MAG: TPM domain-containing protein [Candidatus Latescibacteria bacterium]|nr:TPM domain-containing protein [Candidatus Latescibacterota bacterium]
MKRLFLSLLIVAAFVCAHASRGQALEVPFLAGRVNDTARMLSPQTVAELEAALKAHEDSTSNQVVVLTVSSLEGEALEDYSMKVAETWKIGQKGRDNGVILLVARDDRKVRIEVGGGLEGALPDITCGQIIRHEIVPRFRDGDYDVGVRNGTLAILSAIGGTYAPRAGSSRPGRTSQVVPLLLFMGVIGLFAALKRFRTGSRSRGGWWIGTGSSGGGSSFSGGGGSFSGGGASGSW